MRFREGLPRAEGHAACGAQHALYWWQRDRRVHDAARRLRASQRRRKCIEQCFGWGKTIGPIRQVMVRSLDKVDQLLTLTMAAYNLTRLRSLAALRPQSA